MKKRVALGLIAAMAISTSVAMASPVDMEEGKTNVYIGAIVGGDTEVSETGDSLEYDGDTGYYGGVTYGINDKWGIQVDYNSYGADYNQGPIGVEVDVDAIEVNALYKLNPNLSAFVGYVKADADMEASIRHNGNLFYFDDSSADTDGVQIGLMGSYPFADKWQAFGKVAFGNNSNMYELGVSYEVAKNWDIDLSYRNAEYKDFNDVADAEVDGFRLGISTSF